MWGAKLQIGNRYRGRKMTEAGRLVWKREDKQESCAEKGSRKRQKRTKGKRKLAGWERTWAEGDQQEGEGI